MKLKKRNTKYLRIIFIVLFMLPLFVNANDSLRLYKPKQLIKDFNYLVKQIKKVHPNCYAYVSKTEFDKTEQEVLSKLNKSMTRREFYLIIAPFFGILKDGHTQLWIPYQDRDERALKNVLFFPLKLKFDKQCKCYIKKNNSSVTDISEGDELISINNMPINKIADSLLHYFNGERKEFKIKVLEDMCFELLLWYVYDFKNQFNIEYFNLKNQELNKRTISGISYDEIKSTDTISDLKSDEKIKFNLYKDSSLAIIAINSFDGDKTKFENFYKNCFEQIKINNIRNLIVDIRQNGGGNSSYCDTLLQYLTDASYSQYSALEITKNHKAKQQIKKEMSFLLRLIPLNMLSKKNNNNCFLFELNSLIKPRNNSLFFHGNLYVFTSEFTFSSASNFACTIKDFKIGKIIGQETGGLASCYGPALALKLPITKINFQVSYQHVLRPAGFDDGHGVIPDIFIEDNDRTDDKYYISIFRNYLNFKN